MCEKGDHRVWSQCVLAPLSILGPKQKTSVADLNLDSDWSLPELRVLHLLTERTVALLTKMPAFCQLHRRSEPACPSPALDWGFQNQDRRLQKQTVLRETR